MAMYYPNIFHEEQDVSFFVSTLGSTVLGMVGTAQWGPMNEPTMREDEDEFADLFGPPVSDSNSYMCARLFFQRGAALKFCRVGDGSELQADDTLAGSGSPPTLEAKYPGTFGNNISYDIVPGTLNQVASGADGVTTGASGVFTSASATFVTSGVVPGNKLVITAGPDAGTHIIASVDSETQVTTSTVFAGGAGPYAYTVEAGLIKITISVSGDDVEVYDNISDDTGIDLEGYLLDSEYVTATNGTTGGYITNVQSGTLTGGADGISSVDKDDYIGSSGAVKTGLQLFRDVNSQYDVDMLVCPNYKDTTDVQALHKDVWDEMIDIARSRQDLVCILDAPPGFTVELNQNVSGTDYAGISQFWNGTAANPPLIGAQTSFINSSFATTFWPWVTISDYYNDSDLSLPASCAGAGAIAYSDKVEFPWWAPAGINRGGLSPLVKGVEYDILDKEIQILQNDFGNAPNASYYNGYGIINPVLLIDNAYYVMGQKTMLRSTSLLNRLHVRRLVNKFKKDCVRNLRQLQYEPNDEVTWRQYTELVKPKLDYLVSTRGLRGYEIEVGQGTSMSDVDIDEGRLIGRVVLVLMEAAESIIYTYTITNQGANFNELGAL